MLSTIPHRDSRRRHFFGVGGVEEKARPSCRDGDDDDDDEEPDDDDDDEEPDDDGRDGGATALDEGTSWPAVSKRRLAHHAATATTSTTMKNPTTTTTMKNPTTTGEMEERLIWTKGRRGVSRAEGIVAGGGGGVTEEA